MSVVRPGPRSRALLLRRATVVAVLAVAALGAQSCGKKDSLIVVSLTASPADTELESVLVVVGGVSKRFTLTGGLSTVPITAGLYVGSDVTGRVTVSASADTATATACYQGTGMATLDSAGSTARASILLTAVKSCGGTGTAGSGAAGATGAAGTQGTAGLGAAGAGGAAGTGGAAGMAGMGGMAGAAGMAGAGGSGGGAGMAGAGGSGGAAGAAGASGSGGTLHIVSPPTLTKCTEYFHVDVLTCNTSSPFAPTYVLSVAFSPNGKLLATAGSDGKIKLWKMTGIVPTQPRTIDSNGETLVAFSPDGTMLVEGSQNGELMLYDVATLSLMGKLLGHDANLEGVAFTADSKHVWSVDFNGVLTRHDIGGGLAAVASVPIGKKAYAFGLSPAMTATEQWLAVGFIDGTGDLANVPPGTTATPLPIAVSSDGFAVGAMTFSPNGLTMVAGGSDGVVSFWSVPPPVTGMPSGSTITLPDSTNTPMTVNSLRYSPDGLWLAISVGDSADEYKLAIFDVASRKVHASKLPFYAPLGVAWSPEGDILVAGEDTCGKFIVCSDDN